MCCHHPDLTLNDATRQFITAHRQDDVRQLALHYHGKADINLSFAIQQIQGWQTAVEKLPSWATEEETRYPPHLSMEQCSSELTASYKAQLLEQAMKRQQRTPTATTQHPLRLADLTGGFGVDFTVMARSLCAEGQTAWYVEHHADLCDIVRHNLTVLGVTAKVINCSAEETLHRLDHATVIFLDPARRNEHGGKVVALADCTPNVLLLCRDLLHKSDYLLLKLSPMLDIKKAVEELHSEAGYDAVREIHIVSVDNECKELLLLLQKEQNSPETPLTRCVNLHTKAAPEVFEYQAQADTLGGKQPEIPAKEQYLYEPNASIMKAGCFRELSQQYDVAPISNNSHLFVSNHHHPSFPGRHFVITAVTSFSKKELRQSLTGITHANIAVRNFPITAHNLRQRLKLQDGGDTFLFATTTATGERCLIICKKVKS